MKAIYREYRERGYSKKHAKEVAGAVMYKIKRGK